MVVQGSNKDNSSKDILQFKVRDRGATMLWWIGRSASRMGAGSWVVGPRVGYGAATQFNRVAVCAIFHDFRSNQKQIGQLVCRVTQQRVKRFDEFGSATTASLAVHFEFREGSNDNSRSLIEVDAPHTAEPQQCYRSYGVFFSFFRPGSDAKKRML
ncbi:hypothetical protein ACFX1Q_046431 [Malus domestica]